MCCFRIVSIAGERCYRGIKNLWTYGVSIVCVGTESTAILWYFTVTEDGFNMSQIKATINASKKIIPLGNTYLDDECVA